MKFHDMCSGGKLQDVSDTQTDPPPGHVTEASPGVGLKTEEFVDQMSKSAARGGKTGGC